MNKILINIEDIKQLMVNISNVVTNNNSMIHNINNLTNLSNLLEVNNRELKIIQEKFMNMTLIKFSEIIKELKNESKISLNLLNDAQIDSIHINIVKQLIQDVIKNNDIPYLNIDLSKNNNKIILKLFTNKNLKIDIEKYDLDIYNEEDIIVNIEQSISVIETLEICIGKNVYLLPLEYMVESLQPSLDMIKTIGDGSKEILMLRDEFIPIVRLYNFFDIENNCNNKLENGILIVSKFNNQKIALFVDKFLQQIQSSIKPISENYIAVKGVSATSIRGNNEVGLVLDLNSIIKEEEKKGC